MITAGRDATCRLALASCRHANAKRNRRLPLTTRRFAVAHRRLVAKRPTTIHCSTSAAVAVSATS